MSEPANVRLSTGRPERQSRYGKHLDAVVQLARSLSRCPLIIDVCEPAPPPQSGGISQHAVGPRSKFLTPGWRAECTCGWIGPQREKIEQVDRDIVAHEEEEGIRTLEGGRSA